MPHPADGSDALPPQRRRAWRRPLSPQSERAARRGSAPPNAPTAVAPGRGPATPSTGAPARRSRNRWDPRRSRPAHPRWLRTVSARHRAGSVRGPRQFVSPVERPGGVRQLPTPKEGGKPAHRAGVANRLRAQQRGFRRWYSRCYHFDAVALAALSFVASQAASTHRRALRRAWCFVGVDNPAVRWTATSNAEAEDRADSAHR